MSRTVACLTRTAQVASMAELFLVYRVTLHS